MRSTMEFIHGTTVTTLYFVRHAESDTRIPDETARPLTESGRRAASRLADHFATLPVDRVVSSPYRRALDTVVPIASACGRTVEPVDDLRERSIGAWVEDFDGFSRRQWNDFSFRLDSGESLAEVQARGVSVVRALVDGAGGATIVVGTHGTSMCAILNAARPRTYGYEAFRRIAPLMPYVVVCRLDRGEWVSIEEDPFGLHHHPSP